MITFEFRVIKIHKFSAGNNPQKRKPLIAYRPSQVIKKAQWLFIKVVTAPAFTISIQPVIPGSL
jgi:hypothetical protein